MAYLSVTSSAASSVLTQIRNAIDAGDSPGIIEIYANTRPTNADTAVGSQTLLGTLTFSDPCGTVSGNTLTMSAITQDSSADASGTATWARISSVNATVKTTVMDIDITSTGGGGTMQMNTTNIVADGPILVKTFTITV